MTKKQTKNPNIQVEVIPARHDAMADLAWRLGDCLNRLRASISAQACAGEAGSWLWVQSGSQQTDRRVHPGLTGLMIFLQPEGRGHPLREPG